MAETFTKRYEAGMPGSPALEALGLQWLADAEPAGGVRAARVVAVGPDRLDLELVARSAPGPGAAEAFGRGLAATHASGAPWLGAPPPGWTGDGAIGLAPLSLVADGPRHQTWGSFYYAERLAPYVGPAVRRGGLPPEAVRVFAELGEHLEQGLFDSPQPRLVPGVARLHGDLWAGNVLWTARPARGPWTGATLIDPAAQGGHAETDLAMLDLFGIAGLPTILAAYGEVSPLADGWAGRVGLHQLHPLLVHAYLFGASYGAQGLRVARAYL